MQTILTCLLSVVAFQSLSVLVNSSPYSVAYRNPTEIEFINNTPLIISDAPIPETETSVEKRVIQYLIEKNYLSQKYIERWEALRTLHVLTPSQARRMVKLKKNQRRALLKYQKDNQLPETGSIDNGITRIVFGSMCETPDFDDYDSEEDTKKN